MKRITLFFFLIVTLFGVASFNPVRAFEIREGDENKTVTVPKDTVIKGSLLAAANSVVVDGTIQGDLYCAGQTIIIRGTIAGDVLCAGQTLTIGGTVGGNIRSIGQLLTIAGPVKRNVVVVGQTVSVAPEAVISGEILAAGQTINLNTTIGGDVNVVAQSVLLGENARIAGDFTYTSPTVASEATGAAITGKVSHIISKKLEPKPLTANKLMPKANPWPARAAGSIVFYLILGALVVLIAREKVLRITQQMVARPWFDGLVGFLTIILAPVAIMMVAITIIGIPVAIILGIIFAVMIVLSRIYVSVIVGDKLLSAIGKKKSGLLLQVIIGVIVIELLIKVPVLGLLVSAGATLWGLGGIVMNFGKRKAK
ncbi:MAG: polymer-forming cytoskeletal protein [Candidatus Gottesmanbacteria bacterium]|nr:polymer-forming cytoskeletal protein [Candidatus Gottesmanbacteria bacterium]